MPTYEGFLEELRRKFLEGGSPIVQALQVVEQCVRKVMDLDPYGDDGNHPPMYLLGEIEKLRIMNNEVVKKIKVLSTEVENKRNEVVLLHKEINRTKQG